MANPTTSHCIEMLSSAGRIRTIRMFGCDGIYADDLFIGIVAADRLFLKTSKATQPAFEVVGSAPFTYERAGKQASLSFHEAPLDAMESAESMIPWAKLAIEAALASRRPAKAVAKKST